jgi:hypothetical protein
VIVGNGKTTHYKLYRAALSNPKKRTRETEHRMHPKRRERKKERKSIENGGLKRSKMID